MAIPVGPLSPEQQLEVLSAIWGGENMEPSFVFLPWIPGDCVDKEERRKNWNGGDEYEWPTDKAAILEVLKDHDEDELYFTVNRYTNKQPREQWVDINFCLYADLDDVDPREIEEVPAPSIAWESSPGRFQAVWLMRKGRWFETDPGKLNQRLTYYLGADHSGWDAAQVLRVPGRPNFKPEYKEANGGGPVKGRLLWFRPRIMHDWELFDEILPASEHLGAMDITEIDDDEIGSVDRARVWSRVRPKVSRTVKEYMSMRSGDVTESIDRSEVMWQIERDLADAGCTVAEIIAIVRETPFNKHAGLRNELRQLKNEAIKAKKITLDNAGESVLEDLSSDVSTPSDLMWFNDVVMEDIPRPSWLVHNVWAKGSVGFIAGQPKSYKSYIALDLALSVATGMPFLNDSQFSAIQGRVLYLQEEDGKPLVIHRAYQILEQKAPELSPKGLISFVGGDVGARDVGVRQTLSALAWTPPERRLPLALHVRTGFTVSSDVWQFWLDETLDNQQQKKEQFDLVVIDTLGTTIGEIDADRSGPLNERVLKPLKAMAEKYNVAVAFVHHNRKPNDNGKARSGQQMLGSTALHAWVESALYVQAKDTIMDPKPIHYQVKVERENKLAEDMHFRIRIPHMYEDYRTDEARRQLWEPEVIPGWGEEEAEKKAVKAAAQIDKLTELQQYAFDCLVAEGGGLTLSMEQIKIITGKQEGHLRQALAELVRLDYLSRDGDGWKVNS